MENSSYKVVLTSDATRGSTRYLQHYGVKGMKWGVVNEEKPIGPTRGPASPLQAQTAPKPKIASQPAISGHRYQDLLKQMNARSTNNQQTSKPKEPSRYQEWTPVFSTSKKEDRPKWSYRPEGPVESVPSQWDIWSSEIPEFDPSNKDFQEYQKYYGFIASVAESFANFLKDEGISKISNIADPLLETYDINHYKKELERIMKDAFAHAPYVSPHWNNLDDYQMKRTDFLLALKRNGFDFFTPEEKFQQKNIGYYPTPEERIRWANKLSESSKRADQIMRNRRVTGTQSRVGRGSGPISYNSRSRVVKSGSANQKSALSVKVDPYPTLSTLEQANTNSNSSWFDNAKNWIENLFRK